MTLGHTIWIYPMHSLATKFWLQILTLKSYTALQKAPKSRRSAFGVHLLREEAKEGQRKTMIGFPETSLFNGEFWTFCKVYVYPLICFKKHNNQLTITISFLFFFAYIHVHKNGAFIDTEITAISLIILRFWLSFFIFLVRTMAIRIWPTHLADMKYLTVPPTMIHLNWYFEAKIWLLVTESWQ